MKLNKINLRLIFFSLVIFNFIFSCQNIKPKIDEQIRKNHAQEILEKNYSKSPAARLENDPELANYIHFYLEENAEQLVSHEIVKTLLEESKLNHYDPVFLLAVIKTESQFKPRAIGNAGEIGLMQIKPDTAEWICKKKGLKWKGKEFLKNPHYNIQVGSLYFKYLKNSLKSKAASYIAAYNTRPNNLSRMPASKIQNHPYFEKVYGNYLSIYSSLEKIKNEN